MKKAVKNTWLKIRKYAILRIPLRVIFTVFRIGSNFFTIWLPFSIKKPRIIKYTFQWILSFIKPSYQSGIPFMAFEVTEWLDSFLTKEMTVFEWGGRFNHIYSKESKKDNFG